MGLPGQDWLTSKSGVPKAKMFEKSERGRMLFLGPDVSRTCSSQITNHLDINSAEKLNVMIVIDVNIFRGSH
jgi:hypothetical protein